MTVAGPTPTGAHSNAAPPYQLHDDPMVGALLQLMSEHAHAGDAWVLTVEGDAIRQRVSALKPVNGIPLMIGLIEEQLALRARAR